jgi:uncharacterized protein YjbI with pentapeptide repeats
MITILEDHAAYVAVSLSGGEVVKQAASSVLFEQALLRRMNFTQSCLPKLRLLDVQLEACDLTHADLRGSKLAGADLRGSIINGMQVGAPELKGAIIDPAQAVQVASLLGLNVKEQDA